ncbi:MAG TPA: aminopeptidase [Ktedonobacteraceae bacterium]|nr:aminopeptidase [Ktedonobacteraceae bacterium]
MADIRLQRMADVLVNYSIGVKKGERLALQAPAASAPLLREIYRAALRADALPETFISIPGLAEILYKEASDEQLLYIPETQRIMINNYETIISLWAATNTKELNNVDHSRVALSQKAGQELLDSYMKRTMDGTLRWVAALYPTEASAQDAEMSLSDFEDFCYRACFLDDEDPVARWKELSLEQERRVQWLKGKRKIHLRGQDTDLTFSIEGRPFINCDGHLNFPDGEFFTSPVENSVNGSIRYSFPCSFNGVSVEDVRLRFVDGVVVEATAARGQDYLDQMLRVDEGARRLGEFAFGNNRNVDRCIRHTLFDEKMAGTVHLALGKSIPQSLGVNESAIHWDMVCDLRTGSEIRVDDELFCKDGKFVV